MDFFRLSIITPEASRVFDYVFQLSAKSHEGDFAVLSFHEPFIFYISPGKVNLLLKNNISVSLDTSAAILLVNADHYTVTAEYCRDI